jgi:two-component system, cell cycle response regulator DivK
MVKIPKVLSGWVVLVVDDEEDSLEVARLLLQKAGAKVLTASDGQAALDCLHESKPHFILSDMSMPEVSGWQLIDQLNRNRATSNIPVIALTAHAMAGDRERAIAAGFMNYITKPLDPDKFLQQLLALLVEIPELHSMFVPQ